MELGYWPLLLISKKHRILQRLGPKKAIFASICLLAILWCAFSDSESMGLMYLQGHFENWMTIDYFLWKNILFFSAQGPREVQVHQEYNFQFSVKEDNIVSSL